MTNLFDALEFCLREVEEGVDIETTLKRFPEYADELRPILETAAKARTMASPEPAPEVVRRSRARVMQHAAEMREATSAPRRRSVIPPLQRFALGFAMLAILLLSTNGLLSASASALPGERLYPVKRGWESVRLFFIFDAEARELLQNEFENERLHEVNELLAAGRHEVIDFAGVFMQVNGMTYVSGLQVILPPGMTMPANGAAVVVSGRTNAQGFVELLSLQLLPAGSVVPTGKPIEVDVGSGSDDVAAPAAGSNSGSGNEAGKPKPEETKLSGTLQSISSSYLVVNGMMVFLNNPKIEGKLCIGTTVELKGYYASDGKFIVEEVKGKGSCSGGVLPGGGSNSNLNTNDDDDNGQNENSDSNDNSGDDSGSNDDNGGGSDNDDNSDDDD